MTDTFKRGDKVEWNAGQGTTTGTVQKKVTHSDEVDGHRVAASEDDPRYVVKNDHTGNVTGHKPETLSKLQGETPDQSDSTSSPQSNKQLNQQSNQQSESHNSTSESDRDEYIKSFKEAVNMTPKELENWLKTEESQSVGWSKDDGDDESVGHKSGKRIVEILRKKKAEYSDRDVNHMRKVVGYIHRHCAQRPSGDIEDTRWRYSLMNWGHDPTK